MSNIEKLAYNAKASKDELKYLKNFFRIRNLPKYEIPKKIKARQKSAIVYMFTSPTKLEKRCEEALEIDPFCLEAFYCYYAFADSPLLQMRFDGYYQALSVYASFDEYQAKNYLDILDMYAEFLTVICNFTKAIEVGKTIVMLSKQYSKKNATRLAFAYGATENADEFYRFYQDSKFDAFAYIYLIVTLLKHDDEKRAEEVLIDMFNNIEYSTYLDHCWDLDEDDPKQKEFSDMVSGLSEQIEAVPLFYSFVNSVREKYGK